MKKAKRSITTTICVIVALGVFYLIACACIGNKKFFPNTSINGIDVSSMTVAQAAEEVKEQFRTEYSNASIDVTVKDKKYCIVIEDALDLDVTDAVKKANDEKHFFLARGWNFVAALFGDQEIQAKPSLKDKKLLYTAVKQSELNKLEGLEDKYYTVEKDKIIVTKGRGGYVVDTDALVDRMAELITAGNYAESIECPLTYGDVDLDLIYDEVYVEPADATLDPENDYSVTDSVTGVSFDKDAAAKKLEAAKVELKIKTGEGGRTFGSVSSKEIAIAVKEQLGYDLDKKKIQIKEGIKTLGTHMVSVKLHPEVTAELKVVVKEEA